MINEGINEQYGNINIIIMLRKYKWPLMSLINSEFIKNGFIPGPTNNKQLATSKNTGRFAKLEYTKGRKYALAFNADSLDGIIRDGNYKFYLTIDDGDEKEVEVLNVTALPAKVFVAKLLDAAVNNKPQQDYSHLGFNKQSGQTIDKLFKYLEFDYDQDDGRYFIYINLKDPHREITDTSLSDLLYPLRYNNSAADKLYDKIFDSLETTSFYYSIEQKAELIKAVSFVMNRDILQKYFFKQRLQFNEFDINTYNHRVMVEFETADKRTITDEMITTFHNQKKSMIINKLNKFTIPKKSWGEMVNIRLRSAFKMLFIINFKEIEEDDMDEFEKAYTEYFS